MGLRSAAWSTAARRALRSLRPTSSPISIDAGRANRASPRSARSRTRSKSSPAYFTDETIGAAGHDRLADRAPDRQRRPALERLFAPSRTNFGPATPTSPTTSNTACAIIAAAAGNRRARRRCAWRRAPSRARSCPACRCAARWCRWARTASTARAGTGPRSSAIRSSVPTPGKAAFFADYLDGIRKSGSSVGAVIEVVADGVPAGSRRADLRQARRRSGRRADEHQCGQGCRNRQRALPRRNFPARKTATKCATGNDGKPTFLSNHAGGILGGISTGQPVVARFAVKPTSSILTPRRTVDRYGNETEITTTGRHDPCVGIRAVPVGEAMVACVLADHYLRHRGQVGEFPSWPFPRPRI